MQEPTHEMTTLDWALALTKSHNNRTQHAKRSGALAFQMRRTEFLFKTTEDPLLKFIETKQPQLEAFRCKYEDAQYNFELDVQNEHNGRELQKSALAITIIYALYTVAISATPMGWPLFLGVMLRSGV